jgi:hypothetical protein
MGFMLKVMFSLALLLVVGFTIVFMLLLSPLSDDDEARGRR